MIPTFRLAILTFEVMWSLDVKFWSIMTPRSFSFLTISSSTCWPSDSIVYVVSVNFFQCVSGGI